MPKVNDTHLPERIRKRIAELEAGIEVAVKDIRAVLTLEQQAKLDAAWVEQQLLRKGKRATTAAQQQELGWKSKRELRIEALKIALSEADGNLLTAIQSKLRQADIRQLRIYMDTYGAAIDAGRDVQHAKSQANNALTRAGLQRMDGQEIGTAGLNERDRAIRQLEDALTERAKATMTAEELEQQQLLAEYERAVRDRRKK